MPASPCRVTPGEIYSVAQSDTPITCTLYNAPTVVQVVAAAYTDFATTTTTQITPAADGQSFQIPIDVPGKYVVSVVINETAGMIISLVEDCAGHTPMFWIGDPNSNADHLILTVTA
jgi:hypothetical protein